MIVDAIVDYIESNFSGLQLERHPKWARIPSLFTIYISTDKLYVNFMTSGHVIFKSDFDCVLSEKISLSDPELLTKLKDLINGVIKWQ